ncbi:hypothetical protein SK128_017482, partial [Halocaridina rubra]
DVTLTSASTPQVQECDIAESIKDIDPVRHREEQQHKIGDHGHNKGDFYKPDLHHRADLAEALRQVEPIKAKDDLAEALRQIEPIRAKERSKEKEDNSYDMLSSSAMRESALTSKFTSSMAATSVSSITTTSSSMNAESEVKSIKNEAIMRRRNAHAKRYEDR